MLVVATGISGCGRKDYYKKFEAYAEKKKKKVKVYEIGQMLFQQAKKIGVNVTKENILNTNPAVITALRSAVYENVTKTLPQDLKEYDVVIMSIHAFFFWKKVFTRAYDRFYLKQFKPDMFITFIENSKAIVERLHGRKQWDGENITQEQILLWQNIEEEVTTNWAEIFEKTHYSLAVQQPPMTLYRLLFHPELEPVYVSMPITHLTDPKDRAKVDKFVDGLSRYFNVFDPRTIEIDVPDKVEGMTEVVYHQTVKRDLYYLIRQSRKIIAYFPKVVSSPGVINELREAYETNKDVWLVYPSEHKSPFLVYFCNKVFDKEEDLFKYIEKQGYEKMPVNGEEKSRLWKQAPKKKPSAGKKGGK